MMLIFIHVKVRWLKLRQQSDEANLFAKLLLLTTPIHTERLLLQEIHKSRYKQFLSKCTDVLDLTLGDGSREFLWCLSIHGKRFHLPHRYTYRQKRDSWIKNATEGNPKASSGATRGGGHKMSYKLRNRTGNWRTWRTGKTSHNHVANTIMIFRFVSLKRGAGAAVDLEADRMAPRQHNKDAHCCTAWDMRPGSVMEGHLAICTFIALWKWPFRAMSNLCFSTTRASSFHGHKLSPNLP